MKTPSNTDLVSTVSSEEIISLFEIEELEERLEMTAGAQGAAPNSCCNNASCNCTCSY